MFARRTISLALIKLLPVGVPSTVEYRYRNSQAPTGALFNAYEICAE